MVTKYHSTVRDGILLYGKALLDKKKIRKVFTGEERPLSLVDSNTKYVMNYKPDVYFICRNNKKIIFEVLDSEDKKQDIIVADVITSFLLENIEALYFIYSGTEEDENRIFEALVTISKGLVYKGIEPKELPFDKSGPILIENKKGLNPEHVKKKLFKELN